MLVIVYKYTHNFFLKIETPMDIDIQIDEVAEEELLHGKVSKSVEAKLEEEYGTGTV